MQPDIYEYNHRGLEYVILLFNVTITPPPDYRAVGFSKQPKDDPVAVRLRHSMSPPPPPPPPAISVAFYHAQLCIMKKRIASEKMAEILG